MCASIAWRMWSYVHKCKRTYSRVAWRMCASAKETVTWTLLAHPLHPNPPHNYVDSNIQNITTVDSLSDARHLEHVITLMGEIMLCQAPPPLRLLGWQFRQSFPSQVGLGQASRISRWGKIYVLTCFDCFDPQLSGSVKHVSLLMFWEHTWIVPFSVHFGVPFGSKRAWGDGSQLWSRNRERICWKPRWFSYGFDGFWWEKTWFQE